MKCTYRSLFLIILTIFMLIPTLSNASASPQMVNDPTHPSQVVKLIFIHHSSGENWLRDDNGQLGIKLGQNNYFVSDTNYGWGPNAIGDRTDIPNWLEWFRSGNTAQYMEALYGESGQNSSYTRNLPDPGGENEIVMFKSCFPNSNLDGNPDDPPMAGTELTVGNAKYVYNEILRYFATRQDKLFIVITAPPVSDATYAANARAFNNWLYNDWLDNYPYTNVAVFDFYNVLTGVTHHHRYNTSTGNIDHTYVPGNDTAAYASGSGDDHPNSIGNLKASVEFVPLLNIFYNRWKSGNPALHKYTLQFTSTGSRDGWVLESSENSNQGTTLNSTSTYIYLGDSASKRQYRAVLSFVTSTLPDNAWIISAVLKIKKAGLLGTDPFTTHQKLLVDIRKPYFGTTVSLVASDFQSSASRTTVGSFSPTPIDGWYKGTLSSAAFQWVNPTGTTQLRLRFQLDDDGDAVADIFKFYSGDWATTSNRPMLEIQYYVP